MAAKATDTPRPRERCTSLALAQQVSERPALLVACSSGRARPRGAAGALVPAPPRRSGRRGGWEAQRAPLAAVRSGRPESGRFCPEDVHSCTSRG